MITIISLHPHFEPEMLGFIPSFMDEADPRPLKEQFQEKYSFGGGWFPIHGFDRDGTTLKYPEDPPLNPLCAIFFKNEVLYFYPHSLVLIEQENGKWEVARMD